MKKFKKAALTAASYVSVAALAVGGTVAYWTAKDKDVNVMTLGKGISVELVEQQRSEDGSSLVEFVDGKKLNPIVGSAQGDKDQWGLPVAENWTDKIIRVQNTSREDIYARVLVAFPAAWDADNANDMPLHWNTPDDDFDPDGSGDAKAMANNWLADIEGTTTIDGLNYNIYSFTYDGKIAPDFLTDPCVTGFYLDSSVDYDNETGKYTMNGTEIDYNLSDLIIPVFVQAIQADGFEDVTAAMTAAKFTNDPWNGSVSTIASPASGANKPAGYAPETIGEEIDNLIVRDNSDEKTNLRALYKDGLTGDVSVKNSYLDGTYALNLTVAAGTTDAVLTVDNTDLRGWTSYSGFASVSFTDCTFDENSNPEIYKTIRPYDDTVFTNCDFAAGYEFWLDKLDGAKITLDNCTLNGAAITDASQLNIVYGDASSVVIAE